LSSFASKLNEITWCHYQEGLSHNVHCCENLNFLGCYELFRKSLEVERFFDMIQGMKNGAQGISSGRICSEGIEFLGFVQTGSHYAVIDLLDIIHAPIFISNNVFKRLDSTSTLR
jgi:hypothetical protein